jgi:hypothetical protein
MCTATAIRFGLFAASHLFLVSSLIREEENRVVNVIVFNSLLSATRNGGKNEQASKQANNTVAAEAVSVITTTKLKNRRHTIL